eukprot:1482889-Pyramimonas_sp.AAC.1
MSGRRGVQLRGDPVRARPPARGRRPTSLHLRIFATTCGAAPRAPRQRAMAGPTEALTTFLKLSPNEASRRKWRSRSATLRTRRRRAED